MGTFNVIANLSFSERIANASVRGYRPDPNYGSPDWGKMIPQVTADYVAEYKFFSFIDGASYKEVIAIMEKENYRPANLIELLLGVPLSVNCRVASSMRSKRVLTLIGATDLSTLHV